MLQTLIQIGKQVSEGRGEWDDIIDVPDVSKEREKQMRLYVAEMLFDLDQKEVVLNPDNIKEYDDDAPFKYKNIKIQGGNNKAIYCCVNAQKSLEQFRKTFFGILNKEGSTPEKGQFMESIEKDQPLLSQSQFSNVLKEIFGLRIAFEELFIDKEKNAFLPQILSDRLSMGKSDTVVLLYASVKSHELGISKATPICETNGFEDFIRTKFLSQNESQSGDQKLCYATGEPQEDVEEIAFISRYNINKMFVTTTRNYASDFVNSNFTLNYQASSEAQKLLERGSEYVLDNHTVLIAGANHCIIPQVFSQNKIDEKALLMKLSKRSELLFRHQEAKDLTTQIDDLETDIYWIDFLGYESDGNFFKTINYIKDVSKTHFSQLINTFQNVNREFKSVQGIDWENVMSFGKDQTPLYLNFQTFYNLIPLRKDKEKKNEALIYFKSILEQRKVSLQKLFELYRELILCHRFHRYKSYNNIFAPDTIKDETMHFDYAIRNATYQYLAIFQVLKRLNLLQYMEEISPSDSDTSNFESYQQQTEAFFIKMDYNDAQKAMFYLGRALNAVAYAQVKKEHSSKPILEKVNFNGLETKAIVRLHNDLMEKTKQYRIYDKTEFSLSLFVQFYNPNKWKLSPEESLFFLLSGYSFRIQSEKKAND